jgi:hypothetical protein
MEDTKHLEKVKNIVLIKSFHTEYRKILLYQLHSKDKWKMTYKYYQILGVCVCVCVCVNKYFQNLSWLNYTTYPSPYDIWQKWVQFWYGDQLRTCGWNTEPESVFVPMLWPTWVLHISSPSIKVLCLQQMKSATWNYQIKHDINQLTNNKNSIKINVSVTHISYLHYNFEGNFKERLIH